jgi:hypothetical protein
MGTPKPFCACDSSVASMLHLPELLKLVCKVHANEYKYIYANSFTSVNKAYEFLLQFFCHLHKIE